MFQSTHLHEVRHLWPAEAKEAEHVSIHAPTRGATPSPTDPVTDPDVSIHAPTRGAT